MIESMKDEQFQQLVDKLTQIASAISSNSEILSILVDIQKWIKFIGWSNVKNVLMDCLNTETKLLIYHFSDGEHGIRNIRDRIKKFGLKTSYGGVHGSWQRWKKVGIVEPSHKRQGRFQKVFDLEEFGFEIPKLAGISKEEVEEIEKDEQQA